ncbi:MAG TPA: hypothetical protein PLM71_07685 [Syntrophorhabdaceae bacterium]|nr:hypothetical protein [Syntrophorhabdaceae bacterium]HPU30187.1 hypothetical protein [Syntrophorhabdaceae bacterium]
MERIYVHSKNGNNYATSYSYKDKKSMILYILCIFILAISYFILRMLTAELREDLIFQLSKEREIIKTNQSLKIELSGITKKRYLELKAMEIGLKKPKEEEVVVLR